MSSSRSFLLEGVVAPGLTLVAALVLYWNILPPDADLSDLTRGRFSAAAWPRFMLAATAICCVLQFLRRLWSWTHARRSRGLDAAGVPVGDADDRHAVAAAPMATMPEEEIETWKAVAAVAIVIAYGLLFSWIGFMWSTIVFFLAWLLLGGFKRRPLALLLVTLLGTVFNVYLFVKLAGMPLERGQGFWDGLTVKVYRAMRIY